jgi:hypothetical protein
MVMENAIWDVLPAAVRAQVDELVRKDHRIHAIKVIRDACAEPRPGIHECLDVVADRYATLGQRLDRARTAPLDVASLTAKIHALPSRPAAIEAVWDGDTDGWFVELLATTAAPSASHHLGFIRLGTDLRIFNGQVPPWPEAEEAATVGRALAEHFAVPFHFASPDTPDDQAPRWKKDSC